MEQLVIILLIALISFINWLVKKSAEMREARKREQGAAKSGETLRSEPPPPPEAEPEISMRRLREALGLPDEAQPPALPKRMEQRVPPPLVPPPLPPPRRPPPARPVSPHVAVAPAHGEYRFIEMPHRIGKPAAPRIEVASGRRAYGSSSARPEVCATRWCCPKSLVRRNACVRHRDSYSNDYCFL